MNETSILKEKTSIDVKVITKQISNVIYIGIKRLIDILISLIGLIILFTLNKMNIYTIACMVLITESVVFAIRVYSVLNYKLLNIKESVWKEL